ncbi:MAG: hypothetical protein L6263_12770 [Desulfobacteraceae bacterium]|nr:hypothetical protein [Desulfobacteraceae bacterium]
MKKCPYCFTELDDRASICSSCRKKVGKKGRNGIAKKYTSPVTKFILFIFIIGLIPALLLPFCEQDKHESSKTDVAFQKALQQARAQKENRAISIPKKESTIKKVAPGQARTFTLAEKKKICDHTTIADDISGEIGRDLDEGRKLVAKHFNITMEQLTRISVEGLKKLWSMPPESAMNKPEYRYLYGKGKKKFIHKNLDRYSCYELGYRFGKCAAKSMKGMICDPENDFVMPPRCRNKPETNEGMTAGLKSLD